MAINTFPSSGGGGMPNMNYIGSIHMETFNRSWAQSGSAGFYGVYSASMETGYAYFVGSTTTGVPMNKMVNVPHSFTSINIVSKAGDLVSLYKVQVKPTTVFSAGLSSFPYSTSVTATPAVLTSSGTHSKPSGSLDLVNVILVGGGGSAGAGHGDAHGGGGGGGGGNVVLLYGINASAPVSVIIGQGGPSNSVTSTSGIDGGKTYFGNIFALGGGGGGGWESKAGRAGGNSGGNGGGTTTLTPGQGIVQTASVGLDISGSVGFEGGRTGGVGHNGNSLQSRGGGGGGALGDGQAGGHSAGGNGGAGYVSDLSGNTAVYGAGGAGVNPNGNHGTPGNNGYTYHYGSGGTGTTNGHPGSSVIGSPGTNGAVIVRSFTV